MFKWLTEIEEPIIPFNEENGELRFKRIESYQNVFTMSEVCQLFAAYDVLLGEDALTTIPIPNDQALKIVMNEVVPHYIDIKQVFIDGNLKEINVHHLKGSSRKLFKNLLQGDIYSVIPDLYRSKEINRTNYPRTIKYYLINKELINQIHNKETKKIFGFFNESFFAENGSIMLQPTGWILQEQLKESYTIRSFSTFAKQIVLVVNEPDNVVIGLDIYG